MQDLDTICRQGLTIYVFDTAAFLASLQLMMYGVTIATTESVLEEVKDMFSVQNLSYAIELGRILVLQPSKESMQKAVEQAKKLGSYSKLSRTDLEVIALALDIASKGCKVTVFTDDYHVQNVLLALGIEFHTVKTRGIKEVRFFRHKSYEV